MTGAVTHRLLDDDGRPLRRRWRVIRRSQVLQGECVLYAWSKVQPAVIMSVNLPAGLEASETDQARLRARQAAEMNRSEGARATVLEGFRTLHEAGHLMLLVAACGTAWGVLMYCKLATGGGGDDLRWLVVMSPQIVSRAAGVLFAVRQVGLRRSGSAVLSSAAGAKAKRKLGSSFCGWGRGDAEAPRSVGRNHLLRSSFCGCLEPPPRPSFCGCLNRRPAGGRGSNLRRRRPPPPPPPPRRRRLVVVSSRAPRVCDRNV